MTIVTFRKRKNGDRWTVLRWVENPDAATVSISVEAEVETQAEADDLIRQLEQKNRLLNRDW